MYNYTVHLGRVTLGEKTFFSCLSSRLDVCFGSSARSVRGKRARSLFFLAKQIRGVGQSIRLPTSKRGELLDVFRTPRKLLKRL